MIESTCSETRFDISFSALSISVPSINPAVPTFTPVLINPRLNALKTLVAFSLNSVRLVSVVSSNNS